MLLGKRSARMRFEVLFERDGFIFGSKSYGSINLSGPVLSCMHALALVVYFEPYINIFCHSNVVASWIYSAAKNVYIIKYRTHDLPRRSSPSFITVRKPGFAKKSYAGVVFVHLLGERRLEVEGFEPPSPRSRRACLS